MSVEPPARIVVIGAGPIGLETALYARYLGYHVEIIEAGEVCENLLRWGHVRMFTPFSMNSSPLGLAALKAQDPDYQPPAPDAVLTGREWAEQYLIPLAQSDLLADQIRSQTEVLSIGRSRYLKSDLPGDPRRGDDLFRLQCLDYQAVAADSSVDIDRGSLTLTAKVVIDCSGTFSQHNECLPGGLQGAADLGEPLLSYSIPDCLGEGREQYAGLHTLVIGSGYSAATSIANLTALAGEEPETRITWLTRRPESESGPIARIPSDRLPSRDALAEQANMLATAADSNVEWVAAAQIVSWEETDDERLRVRYRQLQPVEVELEEGEELVDDNEDDLYEEHEITVDRVVANVGYRPNIDLFRELQVHLCYATEGPMKLASALLAQSGDGADCLDQTSCGAEALQTSEPNFYVLGAKSYGRNSNFLYSIGLQQIREAFSVIGGRESLNLYESVKNLV